MRGGGGVEKPRRAPGRLANGRIIYRSVGAETSQAGTGLILKVKRRQPTNSVKRTKKQPYKYCPVRVQTASH